MLAVAAAIVLPLIAGCSVNPATGRQSFTGCLTENDERQIGAKNHPQVLAEFGGEYNNPAVKAYVNDIGQRLARMSDRPNVNYTFTVLNTPDINAFAVPGGYIYVTRGLMALAENEAELAGVISHEIGHIAAKHTNERYCRAMVAQLGVFGLAAATGSQSIAQAANTGAAIYLQGYSRDQEFEADLLGVRYLGRGSYDPNAMSTFLVSMLENSRLEAKLAGTPGAADQFSIFQTHPRTADRVQNAIAQASGTQVAANPIVGRDAYLDHINNILYGDDPKEGLINGRRFSHPALRFEFTVPEGFRLYNSSSAVVARGPNNSAIIFDREQKPVQTADMQRYIREQWAKSLNLSGVDPIRVNGFDGAIAEARVSTNNGERDAWLVAMRWDSGIVYRFVFLAQPGQLGSYRQAYNDTIYSFRRLTATEAAALKPQRLEIVTVGSGTSVESLAARMPFPDYRVERFRVLNALPPNAALTAGQRVKIVVE